MSITTLMKRAARAPLTETESTGALRGTADPEVDASDVSSGSVAATLASRIPAEAIALYTSILAFLVPHDQPADEQSYAGRWVLAGVVALLAVLYAVGTYRQEVRKAGRAFRWPVGKTVVVLVAFAAWVCVIPGSPFNSIDWYTPTLGAIVGLIVNAFLGVSALFFEDV